MKGIVLWMGSLVLSTGGASPVWAVEGTEAESGIEYPRARRVEASDTYHGVEVKDPYRWMEEMESEEVLEWVRAQDRLFEDYTEGSALVERLKERITEIQRRDSVGTPTSAGEFLFFSTTDGETNRTEVWRQKISGATPQRILSPEECRWIEPAGWKLNGWRPSPDGKLLALGLSRGQSAWRRVRILEISSGRLRADSLEGLGDFSTVQWHRDSGGLYYRRYDLPQDETSAKFTLTHPRICSHRLGWDQAEEEIVFDLPEDPDQFVSGVSLTPDGRYLVVSTRAKKTGIRRMRARNLREESGEFLTVYEGVERVQFLINDGSRLLFLTDQGGERGHVIAVDGDRAMGPWEEVIPESDDRLSSVNVARGHLIAKYLVDARPVLRTFDWTGKAVGTLELPGIGGVGISSNPTGSEVFYSFGNLFTPGTVYRLDLKSGKANPFRPAELKFDPEDYVMKQVFFRSKDATRVPMFVAYKKGLVLDGKSPLWMYGYGHGGWSAFPWFQSHLVAWLDLGGVYALPGLRGGGEYGQVWKEAGTRRNKQNTIDDYLGAAEWLIEHGYTSNRGLVANGGSASGMIPAAAVMQRPDLFGGAVIDVPYLDMIRYPLFSQGFTSGFGSPDDPKDFEVLLSYSPYHNVRDGNHYPPILVSVAEKDQATAPLHCYKFTAALQAAQAGPSPILLQVIWGAGHYTFGTTPEERVSTLAEQIAFLTQALEIDPPADWAGDRVEAGHPAGAED